jgi:3-phosphoinositide dependent protein kinase-1
VGTAQYVSPEILKGNAAHLATDLWAFGCILYQMLTGAPPFRAGSEYLIFQKITACEFDFPESFDEDAKDLITKLLRFDPKERLGSTDSKETLYCSIRKHRFFEGIKWEKVRETTPPEMKLKSSESDEREDSFTISDDIEPGLCQKRETSLLLQGDFAENEQMSKESQPSSSKFRIV